jgi:hypothetical protein
MKQMSSKPTSPRVLIDRYLRECHVSIKELAGNARLDPSVIYALRLGKRKCSDDALCRLAALLKCNVDDLAHGCRQ